MPLKFDHELNDSILAAIRYVITKWAPTEMHMIVNGFLMVKAHVFASKCCKLKVILILSIYAAVQHPTTRP